ncbi:MAG: TRAP transporter large permease [Syntrophales bacterium]|jgi:tripartite ATP-independent transporter DctM subunit|nr:TRAP transporter large permease [Syntrophales bacterium]
MSPFLGILGFAVLFLLLFLGVPIAFGICLVGLAGFALLATLGQSVSGLGITAFISTGQQLVLTCIPLFIMMGQFAFQSGVTKDSYEMVHKWVGHLPGGLLIATIFAAAAIGAVTGSSVAAVSTLCIIALPELNRYDYSKALSCGAIASAGTIGIMIPPSIPMVLYGVMTEQSIGKLFIGGIIPGIITAFLFSALVYIKAKLNPAVAPRGPRYPWGERFKSLSKVWGILSLFILVIGGMFAGWFTPTEGGGIGACGAFLLLALKRKMTWKILSNTLGESIQLTAMIVMILIGSTLFANFMAITGLSSAFTEWMLSLGLSRYWILLIIAVIYLFLGCLMDVIGMIVLTVPLFYPLLVKLGFDPIWFGIFLTLMIQVSLITPPVGTNVIIMTRLSGLPQGQIFGSVGWYFFLLLVFAVILTVFPSLATWLPSIMS